MATEFQKLLAIMSFDTYRPSQANNIVPPGWTFDESLSSPHRGAGFDA